MGAARTSWFRSLFRRSLEDEVALRQTVLWLAVARAVASQS